MGEKLDALEAYIYSNLSNIDAHRQIEPSDDVIWENKRILFMEWAEKERVKADEEDRIKEQEMKERENGKYIHTTKQSNVNL